MSTKLHTKAYNNNGRLFFLLNPHEDIGKNDPVRVVDAVVESLDLKNFKKLYRERGRNSRINGSAMFISYSPQNMQQTR